MSGESEPRLIADRLDVIGNELGMMNSTAFPDLSRQMEHIAKSLDVLSENGIPQISAQIAEIWGEQRKRRESDTEFIQTFGKLALVGVKNLEGFGDGRQGLLHPVGDEPGVAEVPCRGRCFGSGFADFLRCVSHFTFFLSGLACGLAITSLIRKDHPSGGQA